MSIDDTLAERGEKYGGSFIEQCQIGQQLKSTIRKSPNWKQMRVDKREALEMICTKISRICYGDHDDIDNWHDIQGYARLIEREIEGRES